MNPLTEPGMEPTHTPTTSPETLPVEAASPEVTSAGAMPAGATVRTGPPDAATPAASGHAMVAARAAARQTSTLARGAVRLIWRHKLETIAVLLLGVGGAVYPPVWLLGVLVALPSKTWDLRDKWTGLVAPVLLVIVSTVLIVVVGGKHPTLGSYAFEAWLGAGRVSRIAAVLGAGYLFWRLRRGPRVRRRPPWVPHGLG
jgi:hypothetical protein